ncbi:hypothetical protein JW851_02185 [Candidatus Woesearchaeota archaeon]|nr:hypothetical protein [Candidatus Woesearchaeota archaeon]
MRNKILVLISLLIILVLVGCSAEQATIPTQQQKTTDTSVKVEAQTEKTPVKVETKEEAITKKTEPIPTVKVEQPPQLPEKIQELILKSQTKVISCKYLLSQPPENRFLDTYFIKGNKIKVRRYEGNAYKIGEYYDTVYLDRDAKTATARCEDEGRCLQSGEDYTRKVFEADYDTYNTKTPMDWLEGLTNAELIGPEVIDGVSTMKIKSIQTGKIIELWLHTTYGVPIKATITESGQPTLVYQYADSAFNYLKDSDVAPKFTTSQY